jgi:hypothetical protein
VAQRPLRETLLRKSKIDATSLAGDVAGKKVKVTQRPLRETLLRKRKVKIQLP